MADTTTPSTAPATGGEKSKATLYWLEQSRSQRIVWLLEECKDLEYNIEVFKRTSERLAPPELKEIHPLGKSPLVSLKASPSADQITFAESALICEYFSEHFAPHLVPKRYKAGQEGKAGGETEQWLRYRYYMHYAEGSLMTLLLIGVFMDEIRNAPVPFFIKPITRTIASRVDDAFLTKNYETNFSFLNSQLDSSPDDGEYLCGKDLTAADILMSFPLIGAKSKHGLDKYPKLKAYVEKLERSEGYVNSVKKIEDVTGEKYKTF